LEQGAKKFLLSVYFYTLAACSELLSNLGGLLEGMVKKSIPDSLYEG
jgi:hypothetical protein